MEQMNIVIVGHVDHGKSTIIGKLLAETNSLPKGKLEQVQEECRNNSKPFEYAFLLDALKDEQAQGITIDAARVFFKSDKRNYIILDAPGHIEFLRNMVTGAARAEAALLVIDASEGVMENSRRHGYMLSLLGIKNIAVLVNKMDLADYSEERFNSIVTEYREFLNKIGIEPHAFIPVSGMQGANITIKASDKMPWYKGGHVLDTLDSFKKKAPLSDQPARLPVQDIYKFTAMGDSRRIVAGTMASGTFRIGDELIFYPSGKKSKIKSFEVFNEEVPGEVHAGMAAGFTLEEQIYITRGEIAVKKEEVQPKAATRFTASLFWLGQQPMKKGRDYLLKLGTSRLSVRLETINSIIDASSLGEQKKDQIEKNDVAECVFRTKKPIVFDLNEQIADTGRFVIVDNYEISGGGIIREELPDQQSWARELVSQRNFAWERGHLTCGERAEKYNQKSAIVMVTGSDSEQSKSIAKTLESVLFQKGRFVYYLGMENILHGLDADISAGGDTHKEHIRRLGELSHILLDAGILLIVHMPDLSEDDIDLIHTMVNPDFVEIVYVGEEKEVAYDCDLLIHKKTEDTVAASKVIQTLRSRGIIFSPWG